MELIRIIVICLSCCVGTILGRYLSDLHIVKKQEKESQKKADRELYNVYANAMGKPLGKVESYEIKPIFVETTALPMSHEEAEEQLSNCLMRELMPYIKYEEAISTDSIWRKYKASINIAVKDVK